MRPFALSLLLLLLASCAIREPVTRAQAPPARPSTVILVHGLYADQSYFKPLQDRLRSAGITTLSPDLTPSDGSAPIEQLALQLQDFISKNVPPNEPLQLVGHSMGGLIALQYLLEPSHSARCRSLYTVATPHRGTLLAALHGGPAGNQMMTNSPFLNTLTRTAPPFPVTTYRSTRDLVIIPNSSSTLPFADNQIITAPGHNEILDTPALADDLIARIQRTDRAAIEAAR